jgi:hypothetical protein
VKPEQRPDQSVAADRPPWVGASLLALLFLAVGLLPLTGYTGSLGSVSVGFDRTTDLRLQGYAHERVGSSDIYMLRIGTWHWMTRVWH